MSGLFEVLYGVHVKMQPGKVFYQVGLYNLFGLNPLGYHIFNHAVFLLNVLLFYAILRKLYGKRLLCISVVLVYAFLPHYSSARFWLQGFEFNLALTFYFLSLYSDLMGVHARPAGFWGWKFSSALSLICSLLINPIAMALFLLNPILVWRQTKRQLDEEVNNREEKKSNSFTELIRNNPRTLFYFQLALVLPLINLNILTAIDNGTSNFSHIFRHIFEVNYGTYDWGLNYIHAVGVAYGAYGIGLPFVVWSTITNHSNIATFVAAGLLGLIIYLFLYSTMKRSGSGYFDRIYLSKFFKHGFIAFVLGYAAYLIDVRVRFSSTGSVNIAAVAAALGVALTMIGFLGWLSNLFRSKRVRRQSFCLWVALFCTAGFLVNNHIASFWTAANEQQHELLDEIQGTFPELSSGTTLIIDGKCPYTGPATVFESNWDLEGALKLLYQDNTIRANIVTADIDINDDRIRISGSGVQNYAFKNLFIYNHKEKKAYPLTNAKDARQYFEMINPTYKVNCKDGRAGFGEPIFKIKSFVVR
ncbi:hypothetical protein IH970_01020 [candidate division KSB1 bacterium]|nr:hypothetical protein [candidate division KSB1 bacterium]